MSTDTKERLVKEIKQCVSQINDAMKREDFSALELLSRQIASKSRVIQVVSDEP